MADFNFSEMTGKHRRKLDPDTAREMIRRMLAGEKATALCKELATRGIHYNPRCMTGLRRGERYAEIYAEVIKETQK